ncbi:AAA family ATPase [Vulcaniibacterium tengchongense]|uniref:AAA domain-containing protein n=1 Tax=Vulcaniibacterium tengchongense TaxID=1273429 RepID=A0A3N4VK52_9GAMM|nr:ATP-binding protein [Vulcaniibacterium tengchongense]RPE81815.1 AAA domain-containing protein [Vulcaniibacterium tengchongense]
MRSKIVPISNVARLAEAGEALLSRTPGMPGMGLCFGPSGRGKTTAVAWLATRQNGVFVRALATSTPTSMLETICRELNIASRGRVAQTVEAIVGKLAETGRPLFVDEADYVVEQKRLVDTLRDLHDLSSVPVILIGMAGIDRRISSSPQLSGRISQWVEFAPCSEVDARVLARELCEVSVADDLVDMLHARAAGSVRNIVVGLGRIEQFARSRSLASVAAADWPRGQDFFLGNAPQAVKQRLQAVG